MSITGVWTCNDGGRYYVRERTRRVGGLNVIREVWWVGIGPDHQWVNVFHGQREGANLLKGKWVDLPNGQSSAKGELTLFINTLDLGHGIQDFDTIDLSSSSGDGFGGKTWQRAGTGQTTPIPAVFKTYWDDDDLTGGWLANDGGAYYTRQVGDELWWFGIALNGGWANVFHGKISDGKVKGRWADVPRAPSANGGILHLMFASADKPVQRLAQLAQTGGYGGSLWTRRDQQTALSITLDKLHCVVETDESGDDEPYALVLSVDLTKGTLGLGACNLVHTPIYEDENSVAAGEDRYPELGVWGVQTVDNTVQPAPLVRSEDAIILVALVENDESSLDSVVATANTLCVTALAGAVSAGDDRASIVRKLRQALAGGIQAGAASGGINMDELIDVDELYIDTSTLLAARFQNMTKTLQLKGDGGHYTAHFMIGPAVT